MAGKFKSRTSWRAKLEKPQEPAVFEMTGKIAQRNGPGKMLIPTPMMVDEVIRTVRRGRLITQRMIRENLAQKMGADVTCPICTGIFTRIAAEAAEEDRAAGKARITPYWRVVSDKGELNPKFPGPPAAQAKLLRQEGHRMARKGKRTIVDGFEKSLPKQPAGMVAAQS